MEIKKQALSHIYWKTFYIFLREIVQDKNSKDTEDETKLCFKN